MAAVDYQKRLLNLTPAPHFYTYTHCALVFSALWSPVHIHQSPQATTDLQQRQSGQITT